uniref:leucine-rich repeat protein n=2 Tax=Gelidibacter sp. TaxID=2018083 RepID=UPI00404A024B
MKKQVLILMTFVIASMSYSQTFTDNFITYNVTSTTNNTVEITGYTGSSGVSVTIPNSVINNNISYTITSIGDFAFVNQLLTSISIGNNVVNIGMFAFNNNQLSTLTIPSSVLTLGMQSFSFNPLTCVISEATTPPVIVTGGTNDTFGGSRSNINLTIPTGTTSAYANATWTGFNSVIESDFSSVFTVDYITYQINSSNNDQLTITDYDTTGGTVVNIPANITRNCETYSVTEIGNDAFISKGITSVTFPNTLTHIGSNAFENNQIQSLTITPNTITHIGYEAFKSNQITNLVIPNGVTHIEEAAFGVNLLTSIDIADSVTFIGEYAFFDNNITDFSSVILPIGFTSLPEGLFHSNQFTNFTIPNSITTIGSRVFQLNQITSVTIPSGVTFIDDRAFDGNPLTDVYSEAIIPATIITGGVLDTFVANRSNIHLHIPPGTMGAYVTNSGALWTGFNPVTEDALSIDEFALSSNVKVITTFDAIKIIASSNLQLQYYTIYNMSGAKVASGNKSEISSSFLARGMYILKMEFDKGTAVRKVIIN